MQATRGGPGANRMTHPAALLARAPRDRCEGPCAAPGDNALPGEPLTPRSRGEIPGGGPPGTGVEERWPRDYAVPPLLEDTTLNAHKQKTRLLAQTFFNQLRESGYTPMQIIGMATELLDLVSEDIKGQQGGLPPGASEGRADFRQDDGRMDSVCVVPLHTFYLEIPDSRC